jgi:hypothetical protein
MMPALRFDRSALLGCCLLLSSQIVAAQQRPWIQGPRPSVLTAAHARAGNAIPADTASRAPEPTHWQRGLLIGGAIGAAGLGTLAYLLCDGLSETRDSCVPTGLGGGLLGGFMGGLIGALIGGQFPKRTETRVEPDSTGASP